MSGIVGIWNLDGRPVEKDLLIRLSSTLAHRGPDGEGLWIEGSVGLACQLLRVTPESSTETQPLVHPSGGTMLVFDGRLDNREELLASLKTSPWISTDSPDSALALAAYDTFGDRFPERLNGDFALGLFDPRRQQLLLVRDALGVRPLYYYHNRNTFLFASEIKAILAHPDVSTRPNDDQLAEYLLGGRPQDNQGLTFFEGVSSLLPAHLAILTPHGFVTWQYNWYAIRMWQEVAFKDFKSNGWQWQKSHVWLDEHCNRLWLAMAVAYLWVMSLGSRVVYCKELRVELTRGTKERLSIFQLGLSFLKRWTELGRELCCDLWLISHLSHLPISTL